MVVMVAFRRHSVASRKARKSKRHVTHFAMPTDYINPTPSNAAHHWGCWGSSDFVGFNLGTMSLTLTNSSPPSSSHIESLPGTLIAEHSSGNPSNGRTLGRSNSLHTVLSCMDWFFTTAIFRYTHGHRQREMGAEEVTRDVESGGREALQLHASAAAEHNVNGFVVSPPPIVVVGGRNAQVAETTIMGNQAVAFEAESGRGPRRYVSEEHVILANAQFIGQQVVGIWIVPTVVGVVSCLLQVVVGSQKAMSDQKLLLYFSLGISLATAMLGIILFILSHMKWNNRRRDLTVRSIVVVALGSVFVDICLLIMFGFIVLQSKPHE